MEDDAFEGLRSLEYLDLSDNKVLSLPAVALSRLPNLKRLKNNRLQVKKCHPHQLDRIKLRLKELKSKNFAQNILKRTNQCYREVVDQQV